MSVLSAYIQALNREPSSPFCREGGRLSGFASWSQVSAKARRFLLEPAATVQDREVHHMCRFTCRNLILAEEDNALEEDWSV